MAKLLEKLKILIPITVEFGNEISTGEDEFDVELLNEEITAIHRVLHNRKNTSNDDDSDEVRGVKRQKIRIMDVECDSACGTGEDPWSYSSE